MVTIQELLEKYRQHGQDTGSTEYQLILLREQIAKEKKHLVQNKKDVPAKRALLKKIARQKKYFSYLKKPWADYGSLIAAAIGLCLIGVSAAEHPAVNRQVVGLFPGSQIYKNITVFMKKEEIKLFQMEYGEVPLLILQRAARNGKLFHQTIQDFFQTGQYPPLVDLTLITTLSKLERKIHETINFLKKEPLNSFCGSEKLYYAFHKGELLATYVDLEFQDCIIELKTSNIRANESPVARLIFEIQLLIQYLCTGKNICLLWSTGQGVIFNQFQASARLLKILDILIDLARNGKNSVFPQEIKEEVKEFLEGRKKCGLGIPGLEQEHLLLYGPPGSGKSYLAQEIGKNEASSYVFVNLMMEFVHGSGKAKQDQLFREAKRKLARGEEGKPVVIIIDEIESVGTKTFSSEQTNVEAVNYEALVRPGRLGFKIKVDYPKEKGEFDRIIDYWQKEFDQITWQEKEQCPEKSGISLNDIGKAIIYSLSSNEKILNGNIEKYHKRLIKIREDKQTYQKNSEVVSEKTFSQVSTYKHLAVAAYGGPHYSRVVGKILSQCDCATKTDFRDFSCETIHCYRVINSNFSLGGFATGRGEGS
ncbi:25131_t:CDS:2 [Cetraspora pellucida]|uniref:25131_t:CDS:1 n=1 Tax=Cetraspora pellucida TaxID=1433469 RepID=A0A9N9FC13_9GLOM|nr:25131_t:CDS:2 [Cetraspora pellucida]